MAEENRWTRGGWRSPAGISSIAAVAGVVVAIIAIFVTMGSGPSPTQSSPAAPSTGSDQYLFVYGTTMPGHLRYPQIETFVAESTRDNVPGRLYDSGSGYPAAVFGAGLGTIEGYVLRLRPDRAAEALRALTEMEAGLFHPVPVRTAGGVDATAYEWIGSTDGLTPIAGMWSGPEA